MSCKRGKANPDAHTKLQLFADSGGYCQNPDCNKNLFIHIKKKKRFHIAEMAHIFGASSDGPRPDTNLSDKERGKYENLILLCPNCHTIVDKAEEEYPDDLISEWKNKHTDNINRLFNIKKYKSRDEVRKHIEPFLNENHTIFKEYGPMTEEKYNPESDLPFLWKKKIHQFILPNNRKILNIIEMNYEYLSDDEVKIFEVFKQHVHDFESKHLNKEEANGKQFPKTMNEIFK
jgi:hypothetical protein